MNRLNLTRRHASDTGFIAFADNPNEIHFNGQIVLHFTATDKLIGLRLISLVDPGSEQRLYAWTYVGKRVLLKLRLRSSPTETVVQVIR
jgi:hypothetical protein